MLNRIFRRARTLFLGWVLFGLLGQGVLYAAPTIEEAAQELRGVQQDIKAERERLARLDAERDAEAAKLRTLENQQAEAARAVYAARFAVSSKESELVDLRAQHVGLEAEIAAGLVGLEDNMRALYLLGEEHVLEGVLSPGDRAQKMRIEGYLAQLRASRVEALSRLRAAREANVRVQHEIEFALEELTRMQLQAESEQATLDGLRAEHAKTVDALEARHSAGEAKVRQMNRDHAELERALQKLELAEAQAEAEAEARALAEKKQREAEVAERRQEEAERLKRAQQAQQDEAQKARDRDKETAERSRTVKAPEKLAEKAPEKEPEKEREKLAEKPSESAEDKKQHARGASPVDAGGIPVSGRKVRGFGDPTGVGELRSRGVFFAAPEGSRVRALAEGKVVFADWVRGYGNLVIVQHKGSYLSLYAQNEAVLKSVGARVQRGEVVATAGRSGGERQTGVYVEVRRGGQPINPTRWSAWPKK
ncbi:MAG: hypothetical protein B7Y40_02000 [Gammaproteobacteria bacterium 28-57-27]|nr:MAG: hypothetical protein B7Y40_02000 [Gammaproteobacteria bacterium 28-57-27]